jgi:uncharacterized damage-inducible protein DinB
MQPDEARMLCKEYVRLLKAEQPTTTRMISAVPAGKGEYTPHPTSMTADALTWHIASSEMWFLEGIIYGKFDMSGGSKQPDNLKTPAAIAAWYETEFKKNIAHVEALSGDHLASDVQFAVFKQPLVTYLDFALRHSIHHRGQLSAYLRPMGAKVPSIYGGSADEPFEMPASETVAAQA